MRAAPLSRPSSSRRSETHPDNTRWRDVRAGCRCVGSGACYRGATMAAQHRPCSLRRSIMFVRLSLCGIAAALALGACSNGSGMLPASSASAAAQSRAASLHRYVRRAPDPCLPNSPKTLVRGSSTLDHRPAGGSEHRSSRTQRPSFRPRPASYRGIRKRELRELRAGKTPARSFFVRLVRIFCFVRMRRPGVGYVAGRRERPLLHGRGNHAWPILQGSQQSTCYRNSAAVRSASPRSRRHSTDVRAARRSAPSSGGRASADWAGGHAVSSSCVEPLRLRHQPHQRGNLAALVYPAGVANPAPVQTIAQGIADAAGVAVDNSGNVFVANGSAGNVLRSSHPAGRPSFRPLHGWSRPIRLR